MFWKAFLSRWDSRAERRKLLRARRCLLSVSLVGPVFRHSEVCCWQCCVLLPSAVLGLEEFCTWLIPHGCGETVENSQKSKVDYGLLMNLEHSLRVLKSSETIMNLGINLRERECDICWICVSSIWQVNKFLSVVGEQVAVPLAKFLENWMLAMRLS